MNKKDLCVIIPISNPVGYNSRYKLYRECEQRMKNQDVNLYTIEVAYGETPFAVTEANNSHHIQLRSNTELTYKENLVNIAIKRLPPECKYVAWVDADVEFLNPNWVEDTLKKLQTYKFVQMWHNVVDMGPHGEVLEVYCSTMSSYMQAYTYGHAAPGGAWAARRESIEAVGGLIDREPFGCSDHHMTMGLIGQIDCSIVKGISPGYVKYVHDWQDLAEKHIRRDVSFVEGTMLHYWHGRKKDKKHRNRWALIRDIQFDPMVDMIPDSNGLYRLVDDNMPRSIRLRDNIRQYFRARNEDSNDLSGEDRDYYQTGGHKKREITTSGPDFIA